MRVRMACTQCGGEAYGYADAENGPHPSDPLANEDVRCEDCEAERDRVGHAEELELRAKIDRGELPESALYDC